MGRVGSWLAGIVLIAMVVYVFFGFVVHVFVLLLCWMYFLFCCIVCDLCHVIDDWK